MSYYSHVMIATTKRDYEKIENALNKLSDEYLLESIEKEEYTEENTECVLVEIYSIKYYKEDEDIQMLEKCLSKVKDGYVFCRLGTDNGDIEFRKRSKLPALMKNFEFIKEMRDELDRELEGDGEEFE